MTHVTDAIDKLAWRKRDYSKRQEDCTAFLEKASHINAFVAHAGDRYQTVVPMFAQEAVIASATAEVEKIMRQTFEQWHDDNWGEGSYRKLVEEL